MTSADGEMVAERLNDIHKVTKGVTGRASTGTQYYYPHFTVEDLRPRIIKCFA